ncbi:MAG: type II toxin-antitoxin system VapC family toxin [Methanophagales archaeon]|nr:type II toxin-antitoxin system VapC family toxin [Methanophagales archaeon]
MKTSYLIDTDWIIDHFNEVEKVTNELEKLAPEGLAVSIISLAELYEGIYYSRDPTRSERTLEDFLASGLAIFGIDEGICKIFGKERGKLRKQGKLIGDFDLLIASTCLYHNLTLLTNNRKHYEVVEGLKIISV